MTDNRQRGAAFFPQTPSGTMSPPCSFHLTEPNGPGEAGEAISVEAAISVQSLIPGTRAPGRRPSAPGRVRVGTQHPLDGGGGRLLCLRLYPQTLCSAPPRHPLRARSRGGRGGVEDLRVSAGVACLFGLEPPGPCWPTQEAPHPAPELRQPLSVPSQGRGDTLRPAPRVPLRERAPCPTPLSATQDRKSTR